MSSARYLGAFLGGCVVSGFVGYWSLHQDIFNSAAEIDISVNKLRSETIRSNQELSARVKALEKEVQECRASLSPAPSETRNE